MKTLTFSVIIPIYNVEDFLTRCVESVLAQDYPKEKIQILLVDDGSKDGSGKIADDYASKHVNIQVFHKENGGLSDARNFGLVHATGDYIIFLDSDDYLSQTTCSDFNSSINMHSVLPDIVAGATIRHIHDQESVIPRVTPHLSLLSGEAFLKNELQSNKLFVAAWSSIYKKSFLDEQNLLFWKGILHEDEDFTPLAYLKAKTVLSTNIEFYHYIIRENSITTQKDRSKNAICMFKICEKLTPIFDNLENEELRVLLKTHLAKIALNMVIHAKLHKKDKRHIINYKIIKQNCIFSSEKIRYIILRISPKLLYRLNNLRRH